MLADLHQYSGTAFWVLQAVVGIIFIGHGWMKMKNKGKVLGGPVHGIIEIVLGAALILNQYAQYAAALAAIIMLGAIYFKIFKWKSPFLVMQSAGWEFDLLILAASLAILTH
jgi:putative oxidoreductase